MAMALREQGDLDGAIESYKRAIHIDPNCAEAYNNIGNIYKEAGNLDSAIENYLTAIKLDPVYVAAHHNLGVSLESQGKTDAAVTSFKQANKLDPENASVRHILAAVDDLIHRQHQTIRLKGFLIVMQLGLTKVWLSSLNIMSLS